MKELFKNHDTNIAAAPLFKEVSEILEALELFDTMMPSNPSHEKENIEQSKKNLFYQMADDTIKFVEFKLSLFELGLKEIKKWVNRDEMQTFYHLSDMVAVVLCKTLGFELGRISYYVRNSDRSNNDELNSNKNSILILNEFFNRLVRLERTEVSEIELRKIQLQVLDLNSKLNNRSILKRVLGIFK